MPLSFRSTRPRTPARVPRLALVAVIMVLLSAGAVIAVREGRASGSCRSAAGGLGPTGDRGLVDARACQRVGRRRRGRHSPRQGRGSHSAGLWEDGQCDQHDGSHRLHPHPRRQAYRPPPVCAVTGGGSTGPVGDACTPSGKGIRARAGGSSVAARPYRSRYPTLPVWWPHLVAAGADRAVGCRCGPAAERRAGPGRAGPGRADGEARRSLTGARTPRDVGGPASRGVLGPAVRTATG